IAELKSALQQIAASTTASGTVDFGLGSAQAHVTADVSGADGSAIFELKADGDGWSIGSFLALNDLKVAVASDSNSASAFASVTIGSSLKLDASLELPGKLLTGSVSSGGESISSLLGLAGSDFQWIQAGGFGDLQIQTASVTAALDINRYSFQLD